MRVRADIAALVRAGHTDAYIAVRLGCHRSTVNRARRLMRPPGGLLQRLYAEALPTGLAEYRPGRQPTSPAQAAANRARLAAALRAVPDTDTRRSAA